VRQLRRALAALGLAIALYGGAGTALGLLPVNRDFAPAAAGIEIAVASNGFHTDVILPLRAAGIDWADWCPPAARERTPRFIVIGWGDRDFYLETRTLADLRLGTALRALLFSRDTLLHVDYLDDLAGLDAHRVSVAPATYAVLAGYLRAAFRLDAAGRPIRLAERGYGVRDAFYAAVGTYSPFETCNEWLAAGLRQAGIRTGLWAPFAFGITAHLGRDR
jgi:uncharacterized protein (TIGR02117 family)